MSIWLVLSLIISLATACERSDGVMSCDRLPDHLDGMEGIRILAVKRTLRRSVDLRQFPLEKVQFHSTEMTCDNIKTQPATQVFLREKLCSVSKQKLANFLFTQNFVRNNLANF